MQILSEQGSIYFMQFETGLKHACNTHQPVIIIAFSIIYYWSYSLSVIEGIQSILSSLIFVNVHFLNSIIYEDHKLTVFECEDNQLTDAQENTDTFVAIEYCSFYWFSL